jgi:hypothetical protein
MLTPSWQITGPAKDRQCPWYFHAPERGLLLAAFADGVSPYGGQALQPNGACWSSFGEQQLMPGHICCDDE